MIGTRVVLGKKTKDEGEKPFWISFADLMSALMVLFLLVMSVALLAVTKNVTEADRKKAEYEQKIQKFYEAVDKAIQESNNDKSGNNKIERKGDVIELGSIAEFAERSSSLDEMKSEELRKFVKRLLDPIRMPEGSELLKNIQVIGFTNKNGDYLYNLNLSLSRSQRLVCVLLQESRINEHFFTTEELNLIRDYFLVSGYSFNESTQSDEKDRRIELRLTFYAVDDKKPDSGKPQLSNFGQCRI